MVKEEVALLAIAGSVQGSERERDISERDQRSQGKDKWEVDGREGHQYTVKAESILAGERETENILSRME